MADKEELLKKLKALAERGVGGEKANAQRMLDELMKKYNISEEKISEDAIVEFDFIMPTFYQARKMVHQVLYSVVGDINPTKGLYSWRYKNRKKYIIKCTSAEFLEFNAKLKFYSYYFKKELNIFVKAFIQVNQIFPTPEKLKPNEKEKLFLTDEELEILNFSRSLNKHSYLKQIESREKKDA